jgi:hypothetical protein
VLPLLKQHVNNTKDGINETHNGYWSIGTRMIRMVVTKGLDYLTSGLGTSMNRWSTCSSSLQYSLRRVLLLAGRAWQDAEHGSVVFFQKLYFSSVPIAFQSSQGSHLRWYIHMQSRISSIGVRIEWLNLKEGTHEFKGKWVSYLKILGKTYQLLGLIKTCSGWDE